MIINLVDKMDPFYQAALEAGVITPKGKVIKPFFLVKTDQYCDSEAGGYIGYGDCLPTEYDVLLDEGKALAMVAFAKVVNEDPQSRETRYVEVKRVVPAPVCRKRGELIVHKEF